METILNYFVNRNTNANAESFNAKIKLFRANLRGVTDTKFFLLRLEKLFAKSLFILPDPTLIQLNAFNQTIYLSKSFTTVKALFLFISFDLLQS
jgi:hypothetical protein